MRFLNILTLITILFSLNFNAKADEGMWIPLFVDRLNYSDLQKAGLKLTPQEIYDINNASLKDAIIQFGGGCTGEIVSPYGLIFTNHHCGYGSIQSQSTVENDYLTYGFWAKNYSEELPIPGLTARFLHEIKDVTNDVLKGINNNTSNEEKEKIIKTNSNNLIERYNKDKKYEVRIASFFNGNEYYMFLYNVYKDVRLVGAPPSSIGKFGADTDNWMWPRHTGDFAVFRVYADDNNMPADYSKNNKPYVSKKYLPISIKPKQQNDFAMIMGYPGTTDRYATSHTIKWATNYRNPMTVKIRSEKLDILREDMDANDEVRIKYASKFASTANYWKYYIGETRGLKNLDIVKRKQDTERDFLNWLNKSKERKDLYGNVLNEIEEAYKTINLYEVGTRYSTEGIFRGTEIVNFSRNFTLLSKELEKETPDINRINDIKTRLKEFSTNYFKDYNKETDIKLLAAMLNLFYKDVPTNQQPAYLSTIFKKYKGNFNNYAEKSFEKTIFSDLEKVNNFIERPSLKQLKNDPIWKLQDAFFSNYFELIDKTKNSRSQLENGRRLFVKGLREMNSNTFYYPDANSTMRLTTGSVQPYAPADAIVYDFVTTLDGVMAKEDPTNSEFVIMPKLKELYNKKDYGRYGEDGKMIVCFLSNNDITGGNSGSPVLNGNGELIGLAFDGNWEAMSGNFAFEPDYQRTINVDIRYVLFIIERYAGAHNIIDELDIRN